MDMESFEKDFKDAVAKMPRELLEVLTGLAQSFGPTLEKVVPELLNGPMKLHIMAAVSEGVMGVLDTKELEAVAMKVLNDATSAR